MMTAAAPILTSWCLRLLLAYAFALGCAGRARAEPAIDVDALSGGVRVAPKAHWLLDPSGRVSFEEVSGSALAHAFEPTGKELTLGLERAAVWLRFEAVNHSAQHRAWLLELAYPHLDYVTLYAKRGDGRVERYDTGDMLPFAQRPVAQPNFLFPLENVAHETLTLYLRVSTTGTLSLPLSAWSIPEFMQHQSQTSAILWMFFGALLMMAAYNAAVFLLIGQGEHLTQALLLVAACAASFTFSGMMFQYVLPSYPALANKAIALFLTLALGACMLTCAKVATRVEGQERYERLFGRAAQITFLLALLILFVSKEVGLRLCVLATVGCAGLGLVAIAALTPRRIPQLRLYLLSWCFPLVGVPVAMLANFGALPPWPVFSTAGYVGCAMQAILTSLALAARVKVMGDHLVGLNEQLSSNVVHLEHALENAKDAREAAQRATRAKDDFLATMSHELRTPLNAIINVPQGLLEDFVERPLATCSRCESEFVLEVGDDVCASTVCLECQAQGTLVLGTGTDYVGEPARTVRFLRKIERAGHHLLRMVDGVLDFSKLQAGRFELEWGALDLGALIREVVDAMSEPALQKGLTICVELPERPVLREGDPMRLQQVLLNLVSNAIKFSESAGTVTIDLGWDAETDADIVRVRDQGIGIAPEHHERIFAGFEQVHQGSNRRYGGTGLGLPISRNLVRMHGGELWVESTLGEGSTFVMRLPRARPRASKLPEPSFSGVADRMH